MENALRKNLVLLLLPLASLTGDIYVFAEVANESETSHVITPDSSQQETNITRAEAARMFALALNLPLPPVNDVYNDVSTSHWAKDYIAAVSKAGLFESYPDGSFKPEQNLTQEELTQLLTNVFILKE